MPDRSAPKRLSGEKETLLDFLDYLRDSVVSKVDGLDEEAVRRSSVPSGTSLLGLIQHLTTMESLWFQFSFAGQDDTVLGDDVQPFDTVTAAVAAYRIAIRTSNDIVTSSVRGRRPMLSRCHFGGFWSTWSRRLLGMLVTPISFVSRSMDKRVDKPSLSESCRGDEVWSGLGPLGVDGRLG